VIRRPALPVRSRATWLRHALRAPGQSLVEFTLVFPILLILLLTVADFGRYFATAIQVESAARTAAERGAREYLRELQPIDATGYGRLDGHAWQNVCNELGRLPNATAALAPDQQCGGLPTLVCVHDGADPDCSTVYSAGGGGIPAQCASLQSGAAPSNAQAGGSEPSKYVEVRVCYRFSTFVPIRLPFFDVNFLPITGDFYIERVRMFTVADY